MIESACHDNQAKNYDKAVKTSIRCDQDYIRENYFQLHDRVIELLNINSKDCILDIGIGTGLLEEKINNKCSLSGIDVSIKMLEKVKEKALNVELKEGSFLSIPFKDRCFSKIITCFAFHHLSDEEKLIALTEMERVLTDNGKIIIGDFMYENNKKLKLLKEEFINNGRHDMIEEMQDENFTNIDWLLNLYESNNYSIKYEQISTISWIVEIQK